MMIITSSRRPGHRTRLLCRELARVLPSCQYVPRGVKTIRKLASIAASWGHSRVMLVNSVKGFPRELRFLEIGKGWRWVDARVRLGEIELQRELGQKVRLKGTRIYAEGKRASEFANFLGKLLGLSVLKELPETGGVMLITSNDCLTLRFQQGSDSKVIGPLLKIDNFRCSDGEGQESQRKD